MHVRIPTRRGSFDGTGARALTFFEAAAARLKSCPVARPARILSSVLLLVASAALASTQEPVELDRVVAVVNNQPILWSDITKEIHFSVLDPQEVNGAQTPQLALQELISRTLIQQQIGKEDATIALPSEDEVKARESDMRKDLPACVRMNCATDAGWQAFLNKNGL